MLEVFFPHLVTAISTIIVVTMATLFFCCWRKKGARGETVDSKPGSTKEDVKKAISVDPVPAGVGRVDNGVLVENTSTPTLVVTSEDLGDFSAVQRETEILRSYRKPAPPRARARHSKAPRHLKNETGSMDVFTELGEEDGKNELQSTDELDSALLGSHSEDKDRPARSSMMIDIEEALATLYTPDSSTAGLAGEDLSSEGAQSRPHITLTVTTDTQNEMVEPGLKSGDCGTSAGKSCPLETLSPTESNVDAAAITVASPKLNCAKPKQGPKVSPKPSPRASARMSYVVDKPNPTAAKELEKEGESSAVDPVDLKKVLENIGKPDNAVNPLQSLTSHTVMATTDAEMLQRATKSVHISTDKETTTKNIQLGTPHIDKAEPSTSNTDTYIIDKKQHEGDRAENEKSKNTKENQVSDMANEYDLSDAPADSMGTNSITEVTSGDSDNSSQIYADSKTYTCISHAAYPDSNTYICASHAHPDSQTYVCEDKDPMLDESPSFSDDTSLERDRPTTSSQDYGGSTESQEEDGTQQTEREKSL